MFIACNTSNETDHYAVFELTAMRAWFLLKYHTLFDDLQASDFMLRRLTFDSRTVSYGKEISDPENVEIGSEWKEVSGLNVIVPMAEVYRPTMCVERGGIFWSVIIKSGSGRHNTETEMLTREKLQAVVDGRSSF